MAKSARSKKRVLGILCLVVAAAFAASFGLGACKESSSRKAGKEARDTYEKSKELLKEGLDKTGEAAKKGLEKGSEAAKEGYDATKQAAQEFQKGWKEGGK